MLESGRLATLNLIAVVTATVVLLGCQHKADVRLSPLPSYQRVVRMAMPHDLKPTDTLVCVAAHDENGRLYDLGCNREMEAEPMVGMYEAKFSEDPDVKQPHVGGNIMGSGWRCHFEQTDVVLICTRTRSN